MLHNIIYICVFTASDFLWCDSERADGWPSAQQGADCRDAGDCVYTWKVGHHHPEERREDVHPARQPRHYRKYLVSFLVSFPRPTARPPVVYCILRVLLSSLIPRPQTLLWSGLGTRQGTRVVRGNMLRYQGGDKVRVRLLLQLVVSVLLILW